MHAHTAKSVAQILFDPPEWKIIEDWSISHGMTNRHTIAPTHTKLTISSERSLEVQYVGPPAVWPL